MADINLDDAVSGRSNVEDTPRGICAKCGIATDYFCTACDSIYYCSRRHQIEDWANHKQNCSPYLVKDKLPIGRYLVTTREFKKGETIMTEDPFAFGPSHFTNRECCIGCSGSLLTDTQTVCSGCDFPVCDKRCPALSGTHAAECRYLKELKARVTPVQSVWGLVLPARCYLLNITNRSKLEWLSENAPEANSRLAKDPQRSLMSPQLKSLVLGFPEMSRNLSYEGMNDLVQKVCAVLHVYSLNYESTFGDRKLSGLYGTASYLQQSCLPNTRPGFEDGDHFTYRKKGPNSVFIWRTDRQDEESKRLERNSPKKSSQKKSKKAPQKKRKSPEPPVYEPDRGRVMVTAIRDIKEGEILTSAHTEPLLCTLQRQAGLLNMARPTCRCARCKHPRELDTDMGTLTCPKCSGPVVAVDVARVPVEQSPWKCLKCGEEVAFDEVTKRIADVLNMFKLVSPPGMMGRMQIATLEKMVDDAESKLHPHHDACIALKSVVLRAYGYNPATRGLARADNRALKKKLAMGLQILHLVDEVGPSVYKMEGLIVQCLIEHSKTILECVNRYFEGDGSWSKNKARQNLVESFRRLKRASEILELPNVRMDDLDYNTYSSFIHFLGEVFLSKAKKHDFNLPKGILDY